MEKMPKHFLVAIQAIQDAGLDDRLSAHVGAVIVKGGSIISVGVNTFGLNEYCHYYAHREITSTHAEINAIFRARRKTDLTGTKMYVARITKPNHDIGTESSVGLAKPCEMCEELIRRYGIKRVFYTIDPERYGVWAPSD